MTADFSPAAPKPSSDRPIAAVQKALDQLVKDKTVLIIAHRLSTIVGAHCIYVLENGSIAEQGTHQTLLEQKGRYAAFWQCQQGNITH